MKKQRTKASLAHILEDLEDVKSFVKDVSREQCGASSLVKQAVCVSLINIGELSRELPDDGKGSSSADTVAKHRGLTLPSSHG